jgi:hypothetical protein
MSVDTFGIEKPFLRKLLEEVGAGSAQLPEFQRGWVWPDKNIASLLASISLGYPAGTLMLLRTGGDVRFKLRPVEGTTPPPGVQPERLILDGQQRLTSLFQAIASGQPVETQDVRKQRVSGWFYMDMKAALNPSVDREDAILFLPPDRVQRNFRGEIIKNYSTQEKEYEACLFPVSKVFDGDDWYMGFQEFWDYDRDKIQFWNTFNRQVIRQFNQYQLPVIELSSDTPLQAVCQVFEKVNTGGVTLTVFELLTATFAADEFDLRQHWEKKCRTAWSGPEYRILREVANTDFLQAVTLLATSARREAAAATGEDDERLPRIGCKRDDMLKLTLAEYERFAPVIISGMRKAAKFLHRQHLYDTKYLPYGSQVIPLAAILATLGQDAEVAGAQDKLARWYWSGVFGELYGGTTETRFSHDVPDVVSWIRGDGLLPRTVEEAQFAPGRLLTLRTRGSAAYKGIYALLLKEGALDWRTGDEAEMDLYFDEAMDIHHIFPKTWCDKHKIEPYTYNSIINKTPLTARTNRIIGGRGPSEYLPRLASSAKVDLATVGKHVTTHLADADLMARDDFEAFFATRAHALLEKISSAMGKPIEDLDLVWDTDRSYTVEDAEDTDDV